MQITMDIRKQDKQLLPVDIYSVVIVSAMEDEKTAKTPRFRVNFEVITGEHEGARHSELYYITEAAKFRIIDLLLACNLPLLATGFDTNDLIGKPLRIALIEDTYSDIPGRQVKKHFRPKEKEEKVPDRVGAETPERDQI